MKYSSVKMSYHLCFQKWAVIHIYTCMHAHMLIYASILTRRVHWKRRMNIASTSGKKNWGHGTLETRGEDIFLSRFFFLYKYNFSLKNYFLKKSKCNAP